jgi:hypothetical protein
MPPALWHPGRRSATSPSDGSAVANVELNQIVDDDLDRERAQWPEL